MRCIPMLLTSCLSINSVIALSDGCDTVNATNDASGIGRTVNPWLMNSCSNGLICNADIAWVNAGLGTNETDSLSFTVMCHVAIWLVYGE